MGTFSRAYFTSCLVMGVFFCVFYFLVRTPHFVLSSAYFTTNVFTDGCNFLCDLFSSTNKAMQYVVKGVVILYVCTSLALCVDHLSPVALLHTGTIVEKQPNHQLFMSVFMIKFSFADF